MNASLAILALMALLTGVGLLLRRFLNWGPQEARRLNELALRLTLPSGVFLLVHAQVFEPRSLLAPGIFFGLTLAVWGLSELVARGLRLSGGSRAAFVLASVFGNIIYIGYPLAAAMEGERGLSQAVLVDLVGLEPLAFTLGPLVALRASAGSISWGAQGRALLLFPPLLAFLLGSLWNASGLGPLPDALQLGLRGLGFLTVPLVMVAFGLLLRFGSLKETLKEALAVAGLRLLLAPLLGFLLAGLLGLEPWRRSVLTLQAATPTMMFTLVLAIRYGLDVERVAGFITFTMLCSVLTLPFWAWVLG